MLKNILKLDGAQKLSKNEQKSINGAIRNPIGMCIMVLDINDYPTCPVGYTLDPRTYVSGYQCCPIVNSL